MYCQYTYNMVGVIKVKTEVLRMLKETDDYLSGQEICERLTDGSLESYQTVGGRRI